MFYLFVRVVVKLKKKLNKDTCFTFTICYILNNIRDINKRILSL